MEALFSRMNESTPQPKTAEAAWTTRKLLQWIESHLAAKGVDSPRVCAQMLVCHVLACERMRLYMEADRPASPDELERLRALVKRAAQHEPVQYLVGQAWFWSRAFAVGPSTLIPRPCTEHLVEQAVAAARAAADAQHAAGRARAARVLEIGTGTGCVAICTAAALRGQKRGAEPGTQAPPVGVHVVATDVVPAALELAQANARTHQVEACITWLAGSLYQPLVAAGVEQGSFDVLVSNPPYVSAKEYEELPQNVRGFEPRSALWGGADGMDVVRPLVASAHLWLKPGGLLAVEVGHHQHDLALAAARANTQLAEAQMHQDYEGFWRVLTARRVADRHFAPAG